MSAAEAKKEKQEKPQKPKKAKAEAAVETAAPVAAAPVAPVAPRTPADPRLKVMKKLTGRFLPKGPLRERLKVVMTRWNADEDHGGVTYDELKAIHKDWMTLRLKKRPQPTQS